jgi:hypothetical protein
MNALITYDVSNKQPEVKKGMKDLDYLDYWTLDRKTYYLPNTTLWKRDASAATAIADMKKVIFSLNEKIIKKDEKIKLERCVAVDFTTWDAIEGDKHSE